MLKRIIYFGIVIAALLSCSKQEQTGPVITRYSDIYQQDGQWYCPLCNQPVVNGDRSKIDPALYLSEWHDIYLDENYFEEKINHISDQELSASLNFPSHLERRSRNLMQKQQKDSLYHIIRQYFINRSDNRRLYHYDSDAKVPFITISEFREAVTEDPQRRDEIVKLAGQFVDPDSGYFIWGVHFGDEIDYNHEWQERSRYGVHYLHFFSYILNAYLASGDSLYSHALEDMFNQWYAQKDQIEQKITSKKDKRRNVVWYELGLGNRTPRLIDMYRVLGKELSPETHMRMLKIVLGSARWLYECVNRTPFHPYNWQTQSAMTLGYIAIMFPEFKESEKWLRVSRNNMEEHFQNDILKDGGYIERTGSYTQYVFGMFYRYMLMFDYFVNDDDLLRAYLPRLEKLMEFTSLTITPLGVNSPFNDCRRSRWEDLLVEMGQFFNRPDFIGAVEPWVSKEKRQSLQITPNLPDCTSIRMPYSRFTVMRENWTPEACFMIINHGPFANHSHYDMLDFEIFANKISIAVDAGLGLWGYSTPNHVSWYKQAKAHNMLMIDQANPVKRDIFGENVVWVPQTFTDYFAASHQGYEKYHDTTCRRHVVFVKGDYWLILDQVFTPHVDKQMNWQLHTPLHTDELKNGFISRERPGALFLYAQQDDNIRKIKREGDADLRGIPGEEPNRKIDWLTFRKMTRADSSKDHLATLIYPIKEKADTEIQFHQINGEAGVWIFEIKGKTFNDKIILSDGDMHRFSENLEGDFTFAWFRSRENTVRKMSLAGVSRLDLSGTISLELPVKNRYEANF
jgi:hypothetical protein